MTDQTPIERATWALRGEGWEFDRDRAHAVFASIDTEGLVQALVDDGWEWHNDELSPTDLRAIALAVKNHLTGKDTQQ